VLRKVLLFIYGLPNFFGTVLGLVGLALLFTGVIKDYSLFIIGGLYGIGYLAAPRPSGLQVELEEALGAADLTRKINTIAEAANKTLSEDAAALVDTIRVSVLDIIAQAATAEANAYQLQVVRQTVNSYLPDMLDTYARLPPAFAKFHVIRDAKTAEQILKEQLGLLDRELKEIAIQLHRSDTDALIVHGEFLKKKFGSRSGALISSS
jgi:hypothetical protein